jgi:hypothetical protein
LSGGALAEFRNRMRQIDAMKEKIFKKEEPAPVLASVAAEQEKAAELEKAVEQEKAGEQENTPANPSDESGQKTPPVIVEQKKDSVEEDVVNKAPETDSKNTETTEQTETSDAMKNYKGKIYRPISISAAQARQKYLPAQQQTQKLPAGVKPVKVPTRKPKYAGR